MEWHGGRPISKSSMLFLQSPQNSPRERTKLIKDVPSENTKQNFLENGGQLEDILFVDEYGNRSLKLQFNMKNFRLEDVEVKTEGQNLIIAAKHVRSKNGSLITDQYIRSYELPNFIDTSMLSINLDRNGTLHVQAPAITNKGPFSGKKQSQRSNGVEKPSQNHQLFTAMTPKLNKTDAFQREALLNTSGKSVVPIPDRKKVVSGAERNDGIYDIDILNPQQQGAQVMKSTYGSDEQQVNRRWQGERPQQNQIAGSYRQQNQSISKPHIFSTENSQTNSPKKIYSRNNKCVEPNGRKSIEEIKFEKRQATINGGSEINQFGWDNKNMFTKKNVFWNNMQTRGMQNNTEFSKQKSPNNCSETVLTTQEIQTVVAGRNTNQPTNLDYSAQLSPLPINLVTSSNVPEEQQSNVLNESQTLPRGQDTTVIRHKNYNISEVHTPAPGNLATDCLKIVIPNTNKVPPAEKLASIQNCGELNRCNCGNVNIFESKVPEIQLQICKNSSSTNAQQVLTGEERLVEIPVKHYSSID